MSHVFGGTERKGEKEKGFELGGGGMVSENKGGGQVSATFIVVQRIRECLGITLLAKCLHEIKRDDLKIYK